MIRKFSMMIWVLLLMSANSAHAQGLPVSFIPLMEACVASGGQVGFRFPNPEMTGFQTFSLYSPAAVDVRKITVNVWSNQPSGTNFVQLVSTPGTGSEIVQAIPNNSSFTTLAKLASLQVTAGNNVIVWCTHISP
ncbi:hypothetical protein U1839_02215 [Sphingomonas sp. RT2P30]|uniref:hypothetical protein n=1 Tax=Parasphingomonas halimpatiens TaxID=3096162 RepID=UPI002FCC51E2